MNWEVARRAIDYLKEHSLCSKNVAISFYGGEPLVNFPLIEECVTYARSILSDKPLTFSISTNGTLVTSKIAEFFHKNSFQVLLSIDGPREIHDGYRKDFNGNGSFDHALKGLRCLFDAYGDESTGKIHLNMVYSPPWSSQRLDRIAELWEEVSWLPKEMKLHISYPTPGSILPGMYSNSGDDEDKSLQEWSYEKFYDEFIGKGFSNAVASSVTEPRIAGLVKRSVCQEPMDQYSLNGCCIPGVRRLYVTVDGTFHVCERINHTAPTIGNVYSGIDIEVIRKIYLDEYTKAIFPFCSNCWAVELCKSCYMDIFSNGKLDFKNREHYCPAEKKSLEVLLSNYCSLLEQDSQKLKYLYDYEQL